MFSTQKILVVGETWLTPEQFSGLQSPFYTIVPIPDTYPMNQLDFLGTFHLVFVNRNPELDDNLENVRTIRSNYPNVPIIVVTPDTGGAGQIVQAFRNGANDCLLTPFGVADVATIVGTYLRDGKNNHEKPFNWSTIIQKEVLNFVPPALRLSIDLLSEEKESDLFIRFFGVSRLTSKGKNLCLPLGTRQRSLLISLLLRHPAKVSRNSLIQRFWEDFDERSAKNNLCVCINFLRNHLKNAFGETPVLMYEAENYFINPDLRIESDISQFRRLLEEAKEHERRGARVEMSIALEKAIKFYTTDILEDLRSETWTMNLREQLIEKYIAAADTLANFYLEKGDFDSVIDLSRRILEKDDCIEEAHRKIIRAWLGLGKDEKAFKQFHECERILKEKLRTKPSLATVALLPKSVVG
jgi:DNA-binding SARP family transcriptional activator